jgi:asparagine synthase (glutamine-hydrolysing)
MCGIGGLWNNGGDIGPMFLETFAKSQSHRGPDDSGQYAVKVVKDPLDWYTMGLVHTRLAVLDNSHAGHQPMTRGPLTITYNGELFNFKTLKGKLDGPWKSETDTEVLLALWEKYGPSCLPMLDGQFAFAIYDRRDRTLTIARDRAGEKPVYWHYQNGVFAFASELKALTHVPGLKWEIDPEAFNQYMMLRHVPAPRSMIKGIQKLEPGHVLTFDGKTVKTKRWYAWEVNPITQTSQANFKYVVELVEDKLIESVKTRLISDRPLGMFLSGGIDSSLVCALAAKLGHTPKTFSIGFEDKSEHERANRTAELLGAEHHERIFGTAEFERVALSIGAHQDEPNGDRSCVPTKLLSEYVREKGIVVALSGDGADELFGGYGRYFGPCDSARQYYDTLLPVGGSSWSPDDADRFEHLFAYPNRSTIHARRQLDFYRYLPCVLDKVDRMSMQHGLEVRTPYLSPDLLNIASQLPTAYLHKGNMGKLVLRELAAKYIDRELAGLPKMGFGMPKSVFDQNGPMIQREWQKALEIGRGLHVSGDGIRVPQRPNMNAMWAIIVFAQWANSFPVKL